MGQVLVNNKPINGKDCLKQFNLKKDTIEKLGITNYKTGKFDKIDEILKKDTGMVVGKCVKTVNLNINGMEVPQLKDHSYVMTLDHFTKCFKSKKQESIYKPGNKSFKELFNRYMGQNLDNKKLLISRTGGLGDILISQSVVQYIKEKFPTCEITYATTAAFVNLFQSYPDGLIDRAAPIPYNVNVLRDTHYHLFFIHGIENCIESQDYNYYDIFQKITGLDYDAKQYLPKLIPNEKLVENILIPKKTICIHMNASTKLRRYPTEFWTQIINMLTSKGYFVGIIDSKNNATEIDNMIKALNFNTDKVFNFAKISKTVSHSISIANKCLGTITVDSFFAHVSGALQKPSVCLCGPFPQQNVVGYYKNTVGLNASEEWVNSVNHCGKYPCFLTGQEGQCPYVMANLHPGCMSSISPELIVKSLEEKIN